MALQIYRNCFCASRHSHSAVPLVAVCNVDPMPYESVDDMRDGEALFVCLKEMIQGGSSKSDVHREQPKLYCSRKRHDYLRTKTAKAKKRSPIYSDWIKDCEFIILACALQAQRSFDGEAVDGFRCFCCGTRANRIEIQ